MYEKIVTQVGPLSCVLYTGQPYILVSTLSALTCVHIHTVRIVGIMARIMASRSKGIRKRGGREGGREARREGAGGREGGSGREGGKEGKEGGREQRREGREGGRQRGREAEKEKEQGEQIEESRERGNIAPCIVR